MGGLVLHFSSLFYKRYDKIINTDLRHLAIFALNQLHKENQGFELRTNIYFLIICVFVSRKQRLSNLSVPYHSKNNKKNESVR